MAAVRYQQQRHFRCSLPLRICLTAGIALAGREAFLGAPEIHRRRLRLHSARLVAQDDCFALNRKAASQRAALLLLASVSLAPSSAIADSQPLTENQNGNFFSFLLGLRQEEETFKEEEKEVEQELQSQSWWNPFERARLMNLEAVLKAEEKAVQAEEQDVKAGKKKGEGLEAARNEFAFKRDAERLATMERLEGRLRFSEEENMELARLKEMLPS
eukprot:TRINITY_DN52973_c0_g1_i1.p1 TRINITY_DN52973_c0_g1~~TRINITY_DN52973_c0_g1_i1.p1  ORF type:complete len:216 (-),score=66.15 TRINITY_DN52973_c0_g1_i1:338-985(-)